jgi:hypothetical protein
MNRHFAYFISWVIGGVLSLCLLVPLSHAQEEEIIVISGRLTGYDTRSVFVDGEQMQLCENGRVLDPTGMRILNEGLVATETVEVVLKNGCATEVRALEIRR